MSTVAVSPVALALSAENPMLLAGTCPCGEPAAPGQIWTTEWYDRHGMVEYFVVTWLCPAHRARKVGRGHLGVT